MNTGSQVTTARARCSDAAAEAAFTSLIRRLVNGVAEQRALAAGEIDAVIDPATGRAVLLPALQATLPQSRARYGGPGTPEDIGHWVQDEQHRFVSCSGRAVADLASGGAQALVGRTLWDLPFDDMGTDGWTAHRQRLEWRAGFRHLTLRRTDAAGEVHTLRLDGDPAFDPQGRFSGYRGTLQSVPDAAADPDGRAFAALEVLTDRICVLDPAGVVTLTNQAWRALATGDGCIGTGVFEGTNFLAACEAATGDERADGLAMSAGIRQVLAGERRIFRYEYVNNPAAGQNWYICTVTRAHDDGDARAVVAYEDITEIKRAKHLLRLEIRVARCLAENDDPAVALQGTIRAVCEAVGWECGRHFHMDAASGLLRVTESWGISAPAVERFMEKSRGAMFRPTAGLAGRVFESGESLWVLNAAADSRSAQAALAHETGMNGAFMFPVLDGDRPIGVLAFAGHAIEAPDVLLLQAVRAIGCQVGRYIRRHRDAERLRQSETRYRRLIELSCDWIWEQDRHFRFTRITGSGIAGAGDVVGRTLWEVPTIIPDEGDWLRHRDEVAALWSFCDLEVSALHPDGQRRYYNISGEPVYAADGAYTGFHGTGLDITRRRLAEIAAREPAR